MPRRAWTDHDTETVIGNLLRVGVLAAAATVLVGGALYLFAHGAEPATRHHTFHGQPADLTAPLGILARALRGDPRGIVGAGLLLLIATPVARVAFSVWAFARERDRLYVGITVVVLAVLLWGLLQG